ncbi:centrosomal protein of 85 kDa-like isoform X3 [Girardinichthys multiradiatus]|uniref:centrosomal protein of 85 kDa-like isoform X3 n=1 Tax=Girardinichthys multiradiatus TaxID=208333 RepID=UPI001FABDA9C|nr:centrosomal protein of 85 kDa-like isoform X3 [Girardinichthys multiradiatus]
MWYRSHFKAGCEAKKAGPSCDSVGWVPGHKSTWFSSLPWSGSRISDGRRQSTVSDSSDTGIGTYCSESLEDDSSSNTTPLFFLPLSQHNLNKEEDGVPSAPAMSSPSSSPRILKTPSFLHSPDHWNRSLHINKPATSPVEALSSMDMNGHQPIRRSSSFTKLSSGAEKNSMKTSNYCYSPGSEGSLDRGVLHGYRKKSKYNLNCYSPHEAESSGEGQQVYGLHSSHWADWPVPQSSDRGTPVQPAVRTQMWLTRQLGYQPKLENRSEPGQNIAPWTEDYGVDGLSPLHQESGPNQMLMGTFIPVNTLLKVKEKLLRERELEIQSQKKQILQLHVWIRENEHRAQQVLHIQRGQFDALNPNTEESALRTSCKPPSDRPCCDKELSKKLAMAELEMLHLNLFFKQVTLKYTEEIRKLEEKIKTRDRYITSLKKKSQRESEKNQEKQQRIETLEKYLSDLPTLNQVHDQSKQQEKLEEKSRHLENTVFQLQKSIEKGCALIKKKDIMIEMQAKTENELIASVQSLRKKVQQCLDDGVRLPVQDLKNLEGENFQLLKQQDYSSRVLRIQKDEMERLTSQLMATSARLQKKRGPAHPQMAYSLQKEENLASMLGFFSQEKGKLVCLSSQGRISEVDELLKEMSLCLLDLQGFCSILVQRAQGEEPNLSLLLGMKSLGVSAEEQDCQVGEEQEELSSKLLEVGLVRREIDELRGTMTEYCAHYVGESRATQ